MPCGVEGQSSLLISECGHGVSRMSIVGPSNSPWMQLMQKRSHSLGTDAHLGKIIKLFWGEQQGNSEVS